LRHVRIGITMLDTGASRPNPDDLPVRWSPSSGPLS